MMKNLSIESILKELDFTKKKKQSKNISINKTKRFHRKKHLIEKTILKTLDDGEIIYGEQSLKRRFPVWLERPTVDYDVYSKHPRREAREAERALDKKFGGDFFRVQPAQHPGTFKVVSNINEEGYADFTCPDENVPFDVIDGHRYVRLSVEKRHRRKSLSDPDYSFRHGKDRDALNRILIYERLKKNKSNKKNSKHGGR